VNAVVQREILTSAILLAFSIIGAIGAEPHIPAGYKLVYQQDFEKPSALEEFIFSDPAAWALGKDDKGGALELKTQSNYKPAVRSPVNISLLKKQIFGDFILEADLLQTSKEYGHRDMCLYFDFVSPTKFYYAHIASAADEHAHNIFIVNDQPRVKIAKETTKGVNWGQQIWHHVRLERNVKEGLIKLYFDDMLTPIMIAQDKTFSEGYVGFGSFDDTGRIDNIRMSASDHLTTPAGSTTSGSGPRKRRKSKPSFSGNNPQISTCIPSSTTRLGGMRKNAVAL
jgi:hypothetical protein